MKEKSSEKLERLNYLLILAPLLFLIILGIYFSNFHNGFSDSKADFGTFGDFVGGSLNPILAFFSLYAIIYTIKIQLAELEYTREELKATKEEMIKSREVQEEQSESFKIQNLSIKQQSFENTFFKLLEHHNELIEKVYKIDGLFTSIMYPDYDLNEMFIEKNVGVVKTYFITLYQILKLVNEQEKKFENEDFNPKIYTNIIRATFDDKLLCILAINCNIKDFNKFKELIENYNFLEHLNLEFRQIESIEWKMFNILSLYNHRVFGNNEKLKNLVLDYKAKI